MGPPHAGGHVSIRFEVRGGFRRRYMYAHLDTVEFQSALRFAVVSDKAPLPPKATPGGNVSIRFEVRGGFRRGCAQMDRKVQLFQSALRFAVVSDSPRCRVGCSGSGVSIRFEVRGGFRPALQQGMRLTWHCFNPL